VPPFWRSLIISESIDHSNYRKAIPPLEIYPREFVPECSYQHYSYYLKNGKNLSSHQFLSGKVKCGISIQHTI
jgi:hypothetical protein